MIKPEILDALLAAGATAEMIVAAVKADAAIEEERRARQVPWPKLRVMALARDGERCGYCGATAGPFEIDHVISRAGGGEDVLANVMVACRACNRSKRDRDADTWVAEKRARDRLRKQIKRAEQRGQSSDVRGHPQTSEGELAVAPAPNKSPPHPQKLTPTPCVGTAPAHEAARDDHLPTAIRIAIAIATIDAILTAGSKRWKGMPPPAGVTDEQWRGFLDHRKAKRETLTPRAYQLLCGKLARHADDEWPPGRVIDHIVERGWLSFEPHWLTRNSEHRNGQRSHHRPADAGPSNPMVRAAADDLARRAARGEADLGS